MSQIHVGENEPLRRNEQSAEPSKTGKFQRLMPQVILIWNCQFYTFVFIECFIELVQFFGQTILSLCVAMSFFYIGLIRGYSAPAVPSILENNPEMFPTKNIASWASSVPPVGACIGSILAAFTLRSIGRKYTIIIASPLATIGWMLIATANHYWVIIGARFLNGFCAGLCLPAAQVYVCNCSQFIGYWTWISHCWLSDANFQLHFRLAKVWTRKFAVF